MNEIKKIMEIEHESLDYISNFFDNFDFYNSNKNICSEGNIRNDFIYYNKNVPLDGNYYVTIDKSIINSFEDKNLSSEIHNFVDYLKTLYNLKYLWIMIYSPKSKLDFHWDQGKNRHVISLNHDQRFFNYENNVRNGTTNPNKIDLYNSKLRLLKNNIDEFNEFFIEDSNLSTIHVLDTKSVYVFGNSLHTFVNDSNKIRAALVFEIMD